MASKKQSLRAQIGPPTTYCCPFLDSWCSCWVAEEEDLKSISSAYAVYMYAAVPTQTQMLWPEQYPVRGGQCPEKLLWLWTN